MRKNKDQKNSLYGHFFQPWRGEGAYLTLCFHPVDQQGKLVRAMLLRSSRTSRPNGSSRVFCEVLGLVLKFVVALAFPSQIATTLASADTTDRLTHDVAWSEDDG